MKIGILGFGRAGRRHALNARSLGHEVFAYDPHPPTIMPRIEGKHAVRWIAREGVIERADAVVIATPSECHLEDMRDCLAHGKHVLVEKPIALIRQRKAVQALVERNAKENKPLTIGVGFNIRFHPLIAELRETLEYEAAQGRPPYYASFTCCQFTESQDALTNGCLETWSIHEIDLAEYLLGPLRLIDHHVDRFSVNLGLQRWEGPPCFVVVHSDMRARQRIRQILVCTENISHRIDLEVDPVLDEHYRQELAAFINHCQLTARDDTLASGEDGVAALQIAERAMI